MLRSRSFTKEIAGIAAKLGLQSETSPSAYGMARVLSAPGGYSMLSAQSRRGSFLHFVVALDGKVIWGLHPQGEMGIGEQKERAVLAVFDPAKPIGRFAQSSEV